MPRNNKDFDYGKLPSKSYIKEAYDGGKITDHEAHVLRGGSFKHVEPHATDTAYEALIHKKAGLK